MTAARTYLAGIKERAAGATEGPWEINRYDHGGGRAYILNPNRVLVADFYGEGNREFLYAARTDLPRMADALLAVLGQADELDRLASKFDKTPLGQNLRVAYKELARDLRAAITEALEGK